MSVHMSTPAHGSPPARSDRPPPADATAPAADNWQAASLDDDMTPVIQDLAEGTPFALATLFARDGGPRPVGAQMVVTSDRRWGFLSGGCIEADVASHARAALLDGQPRRLAYGRGSPFFDIRLPCGGRIDLLVEPLRRDDSSILRLLDLTSRRQPARYLSDGHRRLCLEPEASADGDWVVDRTALPAQRLAVVGSDPFAIAIAVAGWQQGWQVCLIAPSPPAGGPPPGLQVVVASPARALAALAPDLWTAIVVATHEEEDGNEAVAAALASGAGYVGALGSRRRIEARRQAVLAAGLAEASLDRLRAPIGLPIGARSPREIAVATLAEIIAAGRAAPEAPASL